jgi:hypothetical protein
LFIDKVKEIEQNWMKIFSHYCSLRWHSVYNSWILFMIVKLSLHSRILSTTANIPVHFCSKGLAAKIRTKNRAFLEHKMPDSLILFATANSY